MIFKWLKKKKIFSFSSSFIFMMLTLAILCGGLYFASNAFKNRKGAGQWDHISKTKKLETFLSD